jgi:uncharacterized protein YdeI (YjbR/CyaY-like superfamily)
MMITDIEDFFTKGCGRCERFATPDCSIRQWADGLNALRGICRGVGLVETVKWAHPCYVHRDRNIALIGAFRSDFRLSFFNAALLQDPERLLEKQGPNTRHPGMFRFAANSAVANLEPVILAYLQEAMGYAEAGILPPREDGDIALPGELIDALDCDPELAEAFRRLTPGRQRSYVINLNGAKKTETRLSRIVGFRDKILAGKGATEL